MGDGTENRAGEKVFMSTKPKPLNPQPDVAVMSCNDAIGDADLVLADLGGVRLHFIVQRNGKRLSSFAVTKSQARGIIMWLAAFA